VALCVTFEKLNQPLFCDMNDINRLNWNWTCSDWCICNSGENVQYNEVFIHSWDISTNCVWNCKIAKVDSILWEFFDFTGRHTITLYHCCKIIQCVVHCSSFNATRLITIILHSCAAVVIPKLNVWWQWRSTCSTYSNYAVRALFSPSVHSFCTLYHRPATYSCR